MSSSRRFRKLLKFGFGSGDDTLGEKEHSYTQKGELNQNEL